MGLVPLDAGSPVEDSRTANVRLIFQDFGKIPREPNWVRRAVPLVWLVAVLMLGAGTVSSLVGARLARHSVTVPPLRELDPAEPAAHGDGVLPEFRVGEAATEYVADPEPPRQETPQTARPSPIPPEPSRDAAPVEDAEGDDGAIGQANRLSTPPPGTYIVTRSMIDAVANDPASVGAQNTHIAVEHAEDGTPIGLRITGVGRDSVLRDAGIRNGDLLVAVNGEAVNSPQRGVAVYQRLSNSSGVSVELIRRGEPRRIRIEVTDPVGAP